MGGFRRGLAIAVPAVLLTAGAVVGFVRGEWLLGSLALVAAALATALTVRLTREGSEPERRAAERAGVLALVALPGVLTVYLGFRAGGFEATTVAVLAVALAAACVAWVLLARRPFEGLGWAAGLAAVPLAFFAGWTLASATWSGSMERALVEFDRVLLYLLAFLLFASVSWTSRRVRWMVRILALGMVIVCVAGLVTRLFPTLWDVSPGLSARLNWPVTYFNALGLLAALGIVLCLHLTSDPAEPSAIRVLSAAPMSLLAPCLLLTLSRGAMGALIVGIPAYLLLARPRGAFSGVIASLPLAAFATAATYHAEILFSLDRISPAALSQGESLAITVVACALGGIVLRLLLLPVDGYLEQLRLPPRARRPVMAAVVVSGAIALVAIGVAVDAPRTFDRQYERFVQGNQVRATSDPRERLTDPGNNNRLAHWRVARDAFEADPNRGTGAGTYELVWARDRPIRFSVIDAHSLYLEVLSELGRPGLVALALSLLTMLGAMAVRARGRDRAVWAALLAASLMWAVRAGIDWDWEMPVVTLWLFAAGGAAVARRRQDLPAGRRPPVVIRWPTAAVIAAVAVAPVLVGVSKERLDGSVEKFVEGDCYEALAEARGSLALLPVRARPHEIIGLCTARARPDLGVGSLQRAVERDPLNWEYLYGLAVVRAGAGLDPRAAARKALALNRFNGLTQDAWRRFRDRDDPAEWRAAALGARLPGDLLPSRSEASVSR